MYKIGENVLYGSEGVCKITDIVSRVINNQEKKIKPGNEWGN